MNGRLEPCYAINPELWRLFCECTGRDIYPAEHWTELDVLAFFEERKK